MSVPGILSALTIVAIFGPGLVNAMLAFGIILIPRFYRVTRASTISLKQEVFVEASRALGASTYRVVVRHILPTVLQPIIVATVVAFASGIMAEASLSFLGVGVRAPTASWGSMLSTAARDIQSAQYLVFPPGIVIAIAVLSITLVGNGMHAAFGTRSSNAE
jgi:peptide/nickel transport system permease protein